MDKTVVSSRIRLAPNLKDTPFVSRLNPEAKKDLREKIKTAAKSLTGYNFDYIDMEALTTIQAGSMVEEHLISPEFANDRTGAGLLLDRKQNISIMINEEDHLRIQVIRQGEKLERLYETANHLDDALDEKLHFAFSEKLGFLTHCPTNLGTGMRASVMMHLPGLHESGLINKIINTVSQVGLTVRGLYGEGSQPGACLYQVSNQISLGITEEDILHRLLEVVSQIAQNEAVLREKMLENINIEDRIFRAYGILQKARLISSQEFSKLLSDIRLGAEGGLLNLDVNTLDELFIKSQPYTLMLYGGENMEIRRRDMKRAELIRQTLNNK